MRQSGGGGPWPALVSPVRGGAGAALTGLGGVVSASAQWRPARTRGAGAVVTFALVLAGVVLGLYVLPAG